MASGLPKPSRGCDRCRQEVISHLLPSLEDRAQQLLSQEGVQPTERHWVSIQTIQAARSTSFCYVCVHIWCSDLQMCARFVFLVPCVDFDNACRTSPRTDLEEQVTEIAHFCKTSTLLSACVAAPDETSVPDFS